MSAPLRALTVPTAPTVVFYRQGVNGAGFGGKPRSHDSFIHSFILRRLMPRLGKSVSERHGACWPTPVTCLRT